MSEFLAVACLCGAATLTAAFMQMNLPTALALAAKCAPVRIRRG